MIRAFNFKSNTTLVMVLSIFVPRKILFRAFLGQKYKHLSLRAIKRCLFNLRSAAKSVREASSERRSSAAAESGSSSGCAHHQKGGGGERWVFQVAVPATSQPSSSHSSR